MSLTTSRILMTDEQFGQMAKIIYDRSGIHFPEKKKYVIESRLSLRLTELQMDSFDQYIAFLTIGPYQMDEFQEMFNRITINETSFFRNTAQLEVFENIILPKLLQARASSKRLRIWSAACSTGEEPFTLALIIHRSLGLSLNDWKIEILGTDISEKALNVAQRGAYNSYAIRNTPQLVLDRYFKKEGNHHVLNQDIRSMVNFQLHNLNDSLAAKRLGTWDIIFCRNVMIYFDDKMKKKVVNLFESQLETDGTLFIGHSERITSYTNQLALLDIPQGFCYQSEQHVLERGEE